MVHTCCVPGCNNRSDTQRSLSFHRLPLQNKTLLKKWIQKICRRDLPLHNATRVCSEHFETTRGLLSLTVPSLKLPRSAQQTSRRPPPTLRYSTPSETPTHQPPAAGKVFCDACVQTDLSGSDIEVVVDDLKEKLKQSEQECEVEIENQRFQTSHISGNDAKVRFYTGFSTFSALLVCFNFLASR